MQVDFVGGVDLLNRAPVQSVRYFLECRQIPANCRLHHLLSSYRELGAALGVAIDNAKGCKPQGVADQLVFALAALWACHLSNLSY